MRVFIIHSVVKCSSIIAHLVRPHIFKRYQQSIPIHPFLLGWFVSYTNLDVDDGMVKSVVVVMVDGDGERLIFLVVVVVDDAAQAVALP